jgi:endonuclease/exonuclease/phosphatase family metal-dependent hydrolase
VSFNLASFNMENIFDRAKALNQDTIAEGKVVLDEFARINKLLSKTSYSAADKKAILVSLDKLGIKKDDNAGEFVLLRQNRGKLLKRSRGKPVEVVAHGRGDWIGWVELKIERVNSTATRNTARVVGAVAADVLGVIEVDNRVALQRFNQQELPAAMVEPYPHAMLIDGNDERGIDVGLLTRFPIQDVRSHVDDVKDGKVVFSRDCPEYQVLLPSGGTLLLLVNHLKSKGFGTQADSNARRRLQAERVREIYDDRRAAGVKSIAVMGDFNDTPDSQPLAPLLKNGSDLQDVSVHPNFKNDGRPGTFDTATKANKIDYILLSPELFAKVKTASYFRKGVFPGASGTLFEHFPEITKAVEAASDHAAVVVELDL